MSPRALGWVDFEIDSGVIHTLAELTLILVLFTDAARIDLRLLRREHDLPVRLLVIGLPLTIVAGTLVAAVMLDTLTFWEAAVLAAILAPTDAALGQAVVSSERVPVRIRQALNVESGLNDGIALPVILILLSIAGAAEHSQSATYWVQFAALQVILGRQFRFQPRAWTRWCRQRRKAAPRTARQGRRYRRKASLLAWRTILCH